MIFVLYIRSPPFDKNHPKLLAKSNVVGMFFVPHHYCYVLFNILILSQQNNGKYICWDQLKLLYDMDTAKAVGM